MTGIEERTLDQYEEVYDAYFEERKLIPEGRLYEIRFEALESDPLTELRNLYEAQELCDFTPAEPALSQYLASIAEYKKNRFCDVEPMWKEQIARRWRRSFEEWGYAV